MANWNVHILITFLCGILESKLKIRLSVWNCSHPRVNRSCLCLSHNRGLFDQFYLAWGKFLPRKRVTIYMRGNLTRGMIVLKQKAALHYGLPPPSPPQPPSPWSSILRGDDRRPRRRGRRVAYGVRVTQLRDKVIAKVRLHAGQSPVISLIVSRV